MSYLFNTSTSVQNHHNTYCYARLKMSVVSQRSAARVQSTADGSEGTGRENSTSLGTPRSRYPYLKIPTWYEQAPFQYNRRFVLALVPGLLLLGVVEGASIFAALAICVLVVFLVHQGGGSWIAVILTLTSMMALSVVSMYNVAPLVWRSVLNYPIALVSHFIILCCGGLALVQLRAFREYDPSITVMLEKALFSAFPMVLVVPVVWEHLMLFKVIYLPYTVTLTWFVGLSLFIVPLKSSFAKRNTPPHEGLALHTVAAQVYIGLFLVVPLMLSLIFSWHSDPLDAFLTTVVFIFLPAFLLTLLDSQEIFFWIGVSPSLTSFLRQVFGAVALVAGSMLLYRSGQSGLLLLALPLAATQLLAVSASGEEAEGTNVQKLLATTCVGMTYIVGFVGLPWHIVHSLESVVSLSLQAVQVGLLVLALSSVAMFVFWRQLSSAGVWLGYTAAFVSCEHLLLQEGVYPPLLLLVTAALGTMVMYRLWAVQHVSRNASWLCISLHVTKLTQLLLPSSSSPADTGLAHCAVFLVAVAVSRMALYQSRKNLKPLVFFTLLLCLGLFLSVGSLLSPLWLTITHSLLPLSLIVAMSLFACALYVFMGMWSLGKSPPQWLSQLPVVIIGLTMLLGILQPEMGWEMVNGMVVVYSHYFLGPDVVVLGFHSQSPGTLVAAWTVLLEWAVVITVVAAVISVCFTQKSYLWLPTLQCSIMGATVGLLMAAWLLHVPPTSGPAVEYAVVCALTAALVARAITATGAGSYVDSIMFSLQIVLFATNFFTEVLHIDNIQEYESDAPFVSQYAPPTSRLHMVVFLILAIAFKSKQFHLQSVDKSPSLAYMPLAGNVACCLVYVLTLLNPVHMQFVTSVLLSCLVFLLIQQDSLVLRVSTSNFPLAPCILVAVVTLYIVNMGRLIRLFSSTVHLSILMASLYYSEFALLLLGIPGHFLVVWYLWTGKGSVFNMKLWMVLSLFLPNSALAYISTSAHSLTLAGVAVSGLALTAAQSQK